MAATMKAPEVQTPIVAKGTGIGGKVSSLNKKKETPLPSKPKAGAIKKRHIPVSEF